ncbi:dehydrogenase [Litorilinea aerophila]|uniref:Dehydrogenase n=1 Tax=Litorilinea aerophila TaxID=1204385 RepID=A0A540VML7_9CHLR|nr:alpha-ketoacid dehydrogenase subunit alpha/beta [Litorilinea aerophila]MCC9074721.1 dehydrogenase [Litorilinea aerophila]
MTKAITIDPAEVRKPGVLRAPEIPINAYVSDPKAEAEKYGSENLVRMYRDMVFIREFETMLDRIKREGNYHGIEYNHRGPAHLSIGQESAAVGQCYHLTPDDFIFGSHRSHGEILAKSFSAIQKLDEVELLSIMESYMGGAALRVVEGLGNGHGDVRDLAINYVLYGAMAEIFGRENGFNKGMGGSMHAFFPPFGVMPNNAIVGGSADIATGAALFKRINRRPGIVIANIGDASMGCGPVWEAMMLAAMDQYRTLWDPEIGGAPPMLFNFVNNFYGMGGQPKGETMGFEILARVGLGVNPEAMHAERIDGYNPLAVADAIERKRKILEEGRGPVLLDTVTYRFSGHSPSDASAYRTKEEIDLWMQQDALQGFRHYLLEYGHADEGQLDAYHEEIVERLVHILPAAISDEISPRISVQSDAIGELMFSNQVRDRLAEGTPEVLLPKEETRLKVLQAKSRFGLDENGRPLPKLRCLTYAEALFEAMIHRFYEDPTMIAFGEENRDWGGAFGVYRGLTECLPYHRLFNTPISEAAIVGAAVGYAISGGRVVAELMYCDFMGRAGDEIFNQMAKWQGMSGGLLTMPMVLRVSVGSKYGAQHSQDWSSLVAHIPGLKVMFPATPYDAKGMLNLALRGTDPVVFFESQRLYPEPEILVPGGVPVEYYEVEMGEPAIRREGTDLTIVTIGATLYRALEAADELAERYDLSAEVIDARFINPLNYEKIVDSVKKTGKVVLASDACERGSFLHTMASNISQLAFDYLDGPVAVVGARNWITPPAELEEAFFPQKEWIIDTIHERILPLPGHQVTTAQATAEILRRNRLGI